MSDDAKLGVLESLDLRAFAKRIPPNVSDFSFQIYEGEPHFEQLKNRILPPAEKIAEHDEWQRRAAVQGLTSGSADGQSQIVFRNGSECPARVIIAACHTTNAFTISVRLSSGRKTPDVKRRPRQPKVEALCFPDRYPVQTTSAAKAIWTKLWAPKAKDKVDGLLVIAGSTNSGKSELMKGVVNYYLSSHARPEKPIHLVTCEDPIEQWLPNELGLTSCKFIGEYFQSQAIVYTPRSLNKDVISIAQALKDAKRQTPICYVVGEVRRSEDWREVIDFASTGHFVVATTHASSVRESILRIFKALSVTRAQERRMVANALLAVIHAELLPVDYTNELTPPLKPGEKVASGAQLPMIWYRTPSSVNQLTVDGLSSVLPNDEFCLSREQFYNHLKLNKLLSSATIQYDSISSSDVVKKKRVIPLLLNQRMLQTAARERDIDELRKP